MITKALSREPRPQWSQSDAIALEAAQEGIGHVIAIYSTEILAEETKPSPNFSRIDELRALQFALFCERRGLGIEDQAKIQEVRQECGKIVWEWNATQSRTTDN
jgi:hypothetical protein